ncbi:MAG: hypothetical protein IT266_01140 [Saprospiraceae bacterium]|nr:hypothetical protein [Saprospiraceae bacterium]
MKSYFGGLLILLAFVLPVAGQQGNVPELVDVIAAERLVGAELQSISLKVDEIIGNGGSPDEALRDRQSLYRDLHELLASGRVGLTTFSALASQCNYRGFKSDEEAYQDFIDGHWDENLTELVTLLKR